MNTLYKKLFTLQTQRRTRLVAIADELIDQGDFRVRTYPQLQELMAIMKDNMEADEAILQYFCQKL